MENEEVAKLKRMAELVSVMTAGRQTVLSDESCYIRNADNANLGLQLSLSPLDKHGRYKITFYAFIRTVSADLNAARLTQWLAEAGQMHALLAALEAQDFHPTIEELSAFKSSLSTSCGRC